MAGGGEDGVDLIDDRIEMLTEQIGVRTTAADRLHQKTPEIETAGAIFRYYLTSDSANESLRFNRLSVFSGPTK